MESLHKMELGTLMNPKLNYIDTNPLTNREHIETVIIVDLSDNYGKLAQASWAIPSIKIPAHRNYFLFF